MVNEICKSPGSNVAFLHFSSAESASVFYNNYVDKGVTVNGVPFTVHGTKYRDGEYVIYDHKNLNFGKGVVNACVVPVSATTVPMPVSATTVPMPVSATTVPMPVSTDANATALPESTDTNVTTVPTSTNTNISTVLLYWYW
ncbi:hypothetical protein G6F37_008985 [Rhizopus arrhizus]|nr:hypothetical protein G6F38_009016 [Rhizopus arrhizus]KAG1154954.1 hypothetical protein G6F37_008985 [Rhizopus arrhizus]